MVAQTPGLRIGVVGAGFISTWHLTAWQRCDGAHVAAICDPDIEKAKARADAFGIADVYGDLDAMLASGGLDALDLLSPRETHRAIVLRAFEANLPVLCQKPLCDSLSDAEDLVAKIPDGRRLMVNENTRFRPQFRQIRDWIGQGRVGRIRQVRNSLVNSGYLPQTPGAEPPAIAQQGFFRTQRRMLVAEGLIHQFDMLRSLLGPLSMLAARTDRLSEWIIGEDMATIMLETGDGAPVIIEGNRAAPGLQPGIEEDLLIAGSTATVRLAGSRLELLGPAPETVDFDIEEAMQAGFDVAAEHFIGSLATGAPFETSAEDNLDTLRLVEDAYRFAARP